MTAPAHIAPDTDERDVIDLLARLATIPILTLPATAQTRRVIAKLKILNERIRCGGVYHWRGNEYETVTLIDK